MEAKDMDPSGVAVGFFFIGFVCLVVCGVLILKFQNRDTKIIIDNQSSLNDRLDKIEQSVAGFTLEQKNQTGNLDAEMQELRTETRRLKDRSESPIPLKIDLPRVVQVEVVGPRRARQINKDARASQ